LSGPRRDRLNSLVTLLHRIYNKCKHYICNKLYLYVHISGKGLCISRHTQLFTNSRAAAKKPSRKLCLSISIPPPPIQNNIHDRFSRCWSFSLYTFTSLVTSIDTLLHPRTMTIGSDENWKAAPSPCMFVTYNCRLFLLSSTPCEILEFVYVCS